MRAALMPVCLLTLSLAACSTLAAAAWSPPTRDPARLEPGTYAVEPSHTQVLFSVLHLGFTNFYGVFSGASGTLAFDPGDIPHMHLSVRVPVASVFTTSAKLDEELKGADWLNAGKYPDMSFQSTSIKQTGADAADVTGDLTLHGVTRPIMLHAVFNGAGPNLLTHKETLGFQVTGNLQRSDFGVSTYVPLVSDDVTLTIAAAFEKPGP
jgi:polyisoprenoid-binding protein YceI